MVFPKHVQIQTQAFCNGNCPYCPYYNLKWRMSQGVMPSHHIAKLIDECLDNKVEHICLYLMNEPFMDPRMPTILRYIRRRDENVIVEVSTNCKHKDSVAWREFFADPNVLILLNINGTTPKDHVRTIAEALEINATVKALLYTDYLLAPTYWYYVQLFKDRGIAYEQGVVDDRAGNLPFIKNRTPLFAEGGCMNDRLSEWMHILWSGQAILCCQDWSQTFNLGNAIHYGIEEVFNGERYRVTRLGKPLLCDKCARWIPV